MVDTYGHISLDSLHRPVVHYGTYMGLLFGEYDQVGVCVICATMFEDSNPKPVYFCSFCSTFLCRAHMGRFDLRTIGAAKKIYRWMRGN